MRRAVFDSTILISAFLRPGGLSDELLTLAAEDHFALVLAPDLIAETWRKLLTSARLRTRYRYSDERVNSFARGLLRIAEIIREVPPITGVVRDPNDDMVIACAVQARADHARQGSIVDWIVSKNHYCSARKLPNDSPHRNRALVSARYRICAPRSVEEIDCH